MPINLNIARELSACLDQLQDNTEDRTAAERKRNTNRAFQTMAGVSFRQLLNMSTLPGFPESKADEINRRLSGALEAVRNAAN